jgi:hypothetical protein
MCTILIHRERDAERAAGTLDAGDDERLLRCGRKQEQIVRIAGEDFVSVARRVDERAIHNVGASGFVEQNPRLSRAFAVEGSFGDPSKQTRQFRLGRRSAEDLCDHGRRGAHRLAGSLRTFEKGLHNPVTALKRNEGTRIKKQAHAARAFRLRVTGLPERIGAFLEREPDTCDPRRAV